jgi:dienelactone hydrolase
MPNLRRPSVAKTALRICAAATLLLAARALHADDSASLPDTKPLDWQGDLSVQIMDGCHRFIERKIDQSIDNRPALWHRDFSSAAAYAKSVEPNRERFKKILGVVDSRAPARMERFGDDRNPALVARTDRYTVYQVRWPVLDGIGGEGLLLQPTGKPLAYVVAIPDADQTPEQIAGLAPGVPRASQFARLLAEAGFQVVAPVLVSRSNECSGSAELGWTNQTHREWIYRQAYHMGRHVIGYEVQKVLAVVDWFEQERKEQAGKDAKIGVVGYDEGGLLALYAAACDPRIDACLSSGYFQSRQRTWTEPLYRNVWSLLTEFGDAEIATLVAPRGLVVEHSAVPEVPGPPFTPPGGRKCAAVGRITTPPYESVAGEFQRIDRLLQPGFQVRHLASGPDNAPAAPLSAAALARFSQLLGVADQPTQASGDAPRDERTAFDPLERQQRQVMDMENHVQRLLHGADHTRDKFFYLKAVPYLEEQHRVFTTNRTAKIWPSEPFVEQTRAYRKYFWEEVLGKLDDPLLPINPRTRKIYDKPKWTGYEVVLDVYPDVSAWGILLLPKDLKPGQKRPVVVCMPGRSAVPKDAVEPTTTYNSYAAELADRGFITFAAYAPFRGEDRYRLLNRKANAVKASLFSFVLAQQEQLLNWLETLPNVDPKRIAFYGLSYGGEAAVRVPTVLERYCLSICSADFGDWAKRVVSTDSRYGFIRSVEWEMPYFDMGSTFNYAEMSYLMIPRPFMVERGHSDNVAPDEWVGSEYAKVRRMYDELGLGDRTEIEYFTGGHSINGQGTFRFLEKHLRGP